MNLIKISTVKEEGILQASKWIKFQVLLEGEEMRSLLDAIGPVHFANVSGAVPEEAAVISADTFLKRYSEYVAALQSGSVPTDGEYRTLFSSAMSAVLEAFYAIQVGSKFLIKPLQPVIQMQMHYLFYSPVDGKYHPMVLSEESISWGIQFAYPQLYQDRKTNSIEKVSAHPELPNTEVFHQLSKWMRSHTLPTPFEKDGVRINSPIRIGKKTLAWINRHPQLKMKGINVVGL